MTDNFSIAKPEVLNTISGYSNTYILTETRKITEFQLELGDGSTVTVPCAEVSPLEGTTVLAAAIHHLIQRVAALEALNAETDK